MSDERLNTGTAGEALAARKLERAGYTIIARRWRCVVGEIDIVARHGDDLVFVEVRARHGLEPGAALESIGARKKAKLIRLAQAYLARYDLEEVSWRIDVVAVTFEPDAPASVEIVENAIGW